VLPAVSYGCGYGPSDNVSQWLLWLLLAVQATAFDSYTYPRDVCESPAHGIVRPDGKFGGFYPCNVLPLSKCGSDDYMRPGYKAEQTCAFECLCPFSLPSCSNSLDTFLIYSGMVNCNTLEVSDCLKPIFGAHGPERLAWELCPVTCHKVSQCPPAVSEYPGYCENLPGDLVEVAAGLHQCYEVYPSDCDLETTSGGKVWETCQRQCICPLQVDGCDFSRVVSVDGLTQTCHHIGRNYGTSYCDKALDNQQAFFFQKCADYCPEADCSGPSPMGPPSTPSPTKTPTQAPSLFSSPDPSQVPSQSPTLLPTRNPTRTPSALPSTVPSMDPTNTPTQIPSLLPSLQPSVSPSVQASAVPTQATSTSPSVTPSVQASAVPSAMPTMTPTEYPSASPTRESVPEIGICDNDPTDQVTFGGQTVQCKDIQPSDCDKWTSITDYKVWELCQNECICPLVIDECVPDPEYTKTCEEILAFTGIGYCDNRLQDQQVYFFQRCAAYCPQAECPSSSPSLSPTLSPQPSQSPSLEPSGRPSRLPSTTLTQNPSAPPSNRASVSPSQGPSAQPSHTSESQVPSDMQSSSPSFSHSANPSEQSAVSPSEMPTATASASSLPSDEPAQSSPLPSTDPSIDPVLAPTSPPNLSMYPTTFDEPEIGVNRCACQPSAFTIRLNFANSCATNTDPLGDTMHENCKDPKNPFVSVDRFAFLEYNPKYELIPQSFSETLGSFVDRDAVSFNSTASGPVTHVDDLVAHWELYVRGLDVHGNVVDARYHFWFNVNSCSNYPVISGGENWGIATIVSCSPIRLLRNLTML